jgi:hypothetical protein
MFLYHAWKIDISKIETHGINIFHRAATEGSSSTTTHAHEMARSSEEIHNCFEWNDGERWAYFVPGHQALLGADWSEYITLD